MLNSKERYFFFEIRTFCWRLNQMILDHFKEMTFLSEGYAELYTIG
jgi:hypothetical protein